MTDLEYIYNAYVEAPESSKNLLGLTLLGVLRAEMDTRRDAQREKVMTKGEYQDSKLSEWGFQCNNYECKNKDNTKYNEL